MARLESIVVNIEQQVGPVLLVSHVSVLQALVSYFRGSPAEECAAIEVPLNTVLKCTPSKGGGWVKGTHPNTYRTGMASRLDARRGKILPLGMCLPERSAGQARMLPPRSDTIFRAYTTPRVLQPSKTPPSSVISRPHHTPFLWPRMAPPPSMHTYPHLPP